MTEQEWLECTDPTAMLIFLFGPFAKLTDEVYLSRKSLLLACACSTRLGELLPPLARRWQQHAALAAEGRYDKPSLHGEGEEADWELLSVMEHTTKEGLGRLHAFVDVWAWDDSPVRASDGSEVFWDAERKEQATLIRDIFCNPVRSITIDPRWLTSTVVDLATAIYNERAFDRLPILADALMDAGCDNEEIIGHCRRDGPHVRGCWVVDKLLGKD
jgi:hypothetical protein